MANGSYFRFDDDDDDDYDDDDNDDDDKKKYTLPQPSQDSWLSELT